MKLFRFALLALFVGGLSLLIGCSSSTPSQTSADKSATSGAQTAEASEPPEPTTFTAQQCFGRLQAMAMRWSPDAKPFLLESSADSDTLGRDGKSSSWSAMFASPMKNATRTFTCSKNGVDAGLETPYSARVNPFDSFLFKTNSDDAFKIAQEHGGEGLLKKDDKLPVTYALQKDHGQTVPYWFVVYGTDIKDSKGVGVINATTGAFVRATK